MKKKRTIITVAIVAAMALVMVFAIMGCGSDEEEQPVTTEATTTTTTETTTAAPKDNDILKSQLQAMIDEHGRGTSSGEGVTYARMMDMDGDGSKELIVIHDRVTEIFAVKDNKAESIFEGDVGIQYGQTDARYEVLINESIKPTTVVMFNSNDEWVDENITAVSVSGGTASVVNLRASTSGENDTPAREELVNFSIDGKTVSATEYNNEYTRLTEGADKIDPMSPADLDEILASMQ